MCNVMCCVMFPGNFPSEHNVPYLNFILKIILHDYFMCIIYKNLFNTSHQSDVFNNSFCTCSSNSIDNVKRVKLKGFQIWQNLIAAPNIQLSAV